MSATTHAILPDRLYWAVIAHEQTGAAATPGSLPVRDAAVLDACLAEYLPCPFEGVKPAYVTVDRHRVLAAAASREELLSAVGPETAAASPAALPASLAADPALAPLVARLNFLCGDLEPRVVTACNRRAALAAAATIMAVTAALLVGIERRIGSLDSAAAGHREASTATLTALFPKAGSAEAARAALDQDLGRLMRTRAARSGVQRDAADAVESLLAAWPRGSASMGAPKLRTESLAATHESVTLNIALDDRSGAAALSDALRAMPGWRLFQPQFSATAPQPGAAAGAAAGTLSLRLAAEAPLQSEKAGGDR